MREKGQEAYAWMKSYKQGDPNGYLFTLQVMSANDALSYFFFKNEQN
jgi:hypothetical protein